jgi:phospholipid/cholesterol/gamma-HCH transport system ATP-binding protein
MQSVRKVADRVVMLHKGKMIYSGEPDDLEITDNPVVRQFVTANADGPIQPKPEKY